jgi:hypothetical protein
VSVNLEQRLLAAELRLAAIRELHTGHPVDNRHGSTRMVCTTCLGVDWPCLTYVVVEAPFSEIRETLEAMGERPPPTS